mmetsp:Transcript_150637/g.419914  ORF Transcript_150637/g.419914 Transcript_150637/m.419914 type:complete len:519 (+) Transcript_150637:179-1735(+)
MERISKHKGNTERALLTARAKIGALLDSDEVSGDARTQLEEISALIRSVELQVGQMRLGSSKLKNPGLEGIFEASSVADTEEAGVVVENAKRHWKQLRQLYTDCDLVAAEGNRAISPRRVSDATRRSTGSSEGGRGTEVRRLSTQELDAGVAALLNSPVAEPLLEKAGTFAFDAIEFGQVTDQPIFVLFAAVDERARLVKHLRDLGQVGNAANFHARLMHFMDKINRMYENNPYHNALHASDVVMTIEWFFQSPLMQSRTSPLDHLLCIVAGAVHDVGHPGTNNLFQSKTMSPMAIRYNDKSILENMHVSKSFEIMQSDGACNWFEMLPQAFKPKEAAEDIPAVNLQQYVRKGLVEMVLATDMAKHAKTVQDLKIFVEEYSESVAASEGDEQKHEALEQKLLLLDTVLHASDISNPAKPWPIMLKWTKRVLEEFWAQGDEEKRLGLPLSPLCDRETEQRAVPKGQIGFVNFVILPLFTPLAQLIPQAQEAVDHLSKNKAFWEEQDKAQATYEQLFSSL